MITRDPGAPFGTPNAVIGRQGGYELTLSFRPDPNLSRLLGVGSRVLLVVICIRDDAAGQVALRGGQADPRPLAGHQNRKSVFPEFSEALGGPVVEVDVASIVRSGEAPVKEAPRSWSPNSPYFNGRSQLLRDALLDALLCSDSALTHTGAQPP